MENLSIRKINELSKKKKKGFTLVELIIVIAIIAILAAVAVPRFGAIRENANVKADIATAKNIQTAIMTGIANGDIILTPTGNVTLDSTAIAGQDLTDIIDGGIIPIPKAKETKGGHFSASITPNGVVTVTANSIVVLPNPTAVPFS